MLLILNILFLPLLMVVFLQDIKSRAVSLWVYLSIIVLSLIKLITSDLQFIIYESLINLLIIFLEMVLLWLYFKYARNKKILKMIGLGDLVFFIIICLSFSSVQFMIFQVGSLFLSVIISLSGCFKKLIPLAGIQAILMLILILLEISTSYNMYTSDLLILSSFMY